MTFPGAHPLFDMDADALSKTVLVGFEESQTVCRAFRELGIRAFSCDILPTRGRPEDHIQGDIVDLLEIMALRGLKTGLMILHPECTAMALSGNRWYGSSCPRHHERLFAIEHTKYIWNLAKLISDRVCLENPASVVFHHLHGGTTQYVQPWQFGHGEKKKTGLHLRGLPHLTPTNIVEGREERIWRMPPSETRKRDRSTTFHGIADAMADQWGKLL